MDREQPHELFEPFGHAAVERRELLKVFPNLGLLLVVLGQQPLGDDVGHVLPDDAKLLEAVLHPAQALGDELELRVVEQALLQARNEAEADQLADLADLPQEAQVENQVVLFAGPQVVEQFVHDQEQPVVGVLLVELRHHVGQVVLVAVHLIVGGEVEGQPFARHEVFEPAADDVAQALLRGGDFQANDFELPGDRLCRLRHVLVLDDLRHVGVFGQPGDERQQVALARAVVADDEDALVVGGRLELQVGDHQVAQLLGHAL